ncbi:MAG: hypothetical protein R3F55_14950 [Alphaproteobacteria bacterium]
MGTPDAARLASGKCAFDDIYDQPVPDAYFTRLKPLQYQTPHHAQPVFRRAARALAGLRGRRPVEVLDLCCGYGVNAALLNHRVSLADLYRRFRLARQARTSHDQRIGGDAAYFRQRGIAPRPARVTGVDVAANALVYARAVGLLEQSVNVDLETGRLDAAAAAGLARADLVTVTGGFSYIGARSLSRLLGLYPARRQPWVVALPLRQMDFSACEAALQRAGLTVETWSRWPMPHRRFADATERDATLAAIDPDGDPIRRPPSRSHLEAVLYVARPEADAARLPLADLVQPSAVDAGETRAAVSFA